MEHKSLCDHCSKPGACCDGFTIKRGSLPVTVDVNDPGWKESYQQSLEENDLGFLHPKGANQNRVPQLGCSRLKDGRCSDYGNRPKFCRDFQPCSDPLCVEFGMDTATMYARLFE